MTSTLNDVYQQHPDTIGPDVAASVAAERMRQRTVGSLIVVDENHKPIGIVTDRDLVIRVLADGREPAETPVSEIMTPDVVVAAADVSTTSALRLMREGTFRRLPLVDARGRLSGIVSLDDVVMSLAHKLNEISHILEQETPGAVAYRP